MCIYSKDFYYPVSRRLNNSIATKQTRNELGKSIYSSVKVRSQSKSGSVFKKWIVGTFWHETHYKLIRLQKI